MQQWPSAGTSSEAGPGEAVCAAPHRAQRGDFFESVAADPLDFRTVDFRAVDFRAVDSPELDSPEVDSPEVDSSESVESV